MTELTIDGKNIQADKGSTILKAAKENGIEIPALCYHEGLSPLANCRLCVVEVTQKGRTRVVTSCNYQVEEGMKVETKTDNLIAIRKMIVELLMGRSPNVKIVRELAQEVGIDKPRFTLENEKCILCGMCVHVCSEYIGASAITFSSHGTKKSVSAPLYMSAKDCIGCGACVEICPAQCITMKDVNDARTYYSGKQEEIGSARLIHNWNARVAWKKCETCGNPFPPPSTKAYLEKGEQLPKGFFDICEKCQ
jgi:NADH dehydrogenase/NADH:ubiquinone oxidoreductase subunit G